MLLFRANVPLLIGHIPKEGPAVIPEKAGLVPVCDKPGVRGGLKFSICVALVAGVGCVAVWRVQAEDFSAVYTCCGGGQENHIGFPLVTG